MPYRIILLFFLLMNFISIGQIEDLSFGTNDTFDIMTWNIEQFPKMVKQLSITCLKLFKI